MLGPRIILERMYRQDMYLGCRVGAKASMRWRERWIFWATENVPLAISTRGRANIVPVEPGAG